jgi:hypothetical protein
MFRLVTPHVVDHQDKRMDAMKTLWFIGMAAPFLLSMPAFGQEKHATIGNFHLVVTPSATMDRNNVKALAAAPGNRNSVELRCIDGQTSVAILRQGGNLTEGDKFEIKFRADDKAVVAREASALDDTIIDIANPYLLLDEIAGAKSATFQVVSPDTSYTFMISFQQAAKAVAEVKKACTK